LKKYEKIFGFIIGFFELKFIICKNFTIQEYRETIKIKPDDDLAHYYRENVLVHVGNSKGAIEAYQNFIYRHRNTQNALSEHINTSVS